jgi:hypothetical protein
MDDINSKKLSGEQTANQLVDKLNLGLFKQLSDHELDVFKQQLANRLKLVQTGPPSNLYETSNKPSPIKERLKTMIRKELMGDEDEEAIKDKYMYKLNAYKNMKLNRASDFEITQARKELVDAAKAYGIDLPTQ